MRFNDAHYVNRHSFLCCNFTITERCCDSSYQGGIHVPPGQFRLNTLMKSLLFQEAIINQVLNWFTNESWPLIYNIQYNNRTSITLKLHLSLSAVNAELLYIMLSPVLVPFDEFYGLAALEESKEAFLKWGIENVIFELQYQLSANTRYLHFVLVLWTILITRIKKGR